MKPATLDRLIWTLIYGGLLTAVLGLALRRGPPTLGWALVGAGAVATLAGVALVGVRARRPDRPRPEEH